MANNNKKKTTKTSGKKVDNVKKEENEIKESKENTKVQEVNKHDIVRIVFVIILLGIIIISYSCRVASTKKYAKDFKNTYESINNKKIGTHKYRKLTINENNPFRHVSQDYVQKMLEDNKSFYLYVGDEKCPWCRSAIEKAIEVANKKNIKTIYYVNIWDKDYNEILRDKYKINDNGEKEKVNDGTKLYNLMLKRFNGILADYTLTDDENVNVKVGEKRIYAPTFIYVEKGKGKRMTTAISDLQDDAYGELTKEILKDEEVKLNEFFK